MNAKQIVNLVKQHTGVEHGAAAFNITVDYVKPLKTSNHKGNINWSMAEDIINEDEDSFMDWVQNVAPDKYHHLRPVKIEKEEEPELLIVDKEIYAKTNLNPDQRKKLEIIKILKDEIDASGEEGYPFFTRAKEMKMIIAESNAMVKTGILRRRKSTINKRRYVYSWSGEAIDSKLIQKLELAALELTRQTSRTYLAKKKAKKLAEKAEKDAEILRLKTEKLKRLAEKSETVTHKMQGGSLGDPENSDWINSWKAKNQGLSLNDIDQLAKTAEIKNEVAVENTIVPAIPEIESKKEPSKDDIPITVSVTTNGSRKTVSITIEV